MLQRYSIQKHSEESDCEMQINENNVNQERKEEKMKKTCK
jgi:hypothetical protein